MKISTTPTSSRLASAAVSTDTSSKELHAPGKVSRSSSLGLKKRPQPANASESTSHRRLLTNVRVSYRGFEAYDMEPDTQPDLFAERPIVVIGKWRGPKQGRIEVTGRTANGTFSKLFDVKDSMTRPEHAALPQLWARNRIARLSDFNFSRDDAEAIREVTSLGLTYSLLTQHTSFIAVLEEVRNAGGRGPNVDQPLPLPDGVSELAVGYGSGAEPGFWILLFGAAALVAIAARSRVRSC